VEINALGLRRPTIRVPPDPGHRHQERLQVARSDRSFNPPCQLPSAHVGQSEFKQNCIRRLDRDRPDRFLTTTRDPCGEPGEFQNLGCAVGRVGITVHDQD